MKYNITLSTHGLQATIKSFHLPEDSFVFTEICKVNENESFIKTDTVQIVSTDGDETTISFGLYEIDSENQSLFVTDEIKFIPYKRGFAGEPAYLVRYCYDLSFFPEGMYYNDIEGYSASKIAESAIDDETFYFYDIENGMSVL